MTAVCPSFATSPSQRLSISDNGTSIHPVAQAKNLGITLGYSSSLSPHAMHRKFFKVSPIAAPHFIQSKCLQWPDHPSLPLSTYLLPLSSHPLPSRWALLFFEPSMNVPTSGPLHRTPTPNIFIIHFFTHFRSLLRGHMLSDASLNIPFKLYSPLSMPTEFYLRHPSPSNKLYNLITIKLHFTIQVVP